MIYILYFITTLLLAPALFGVLFYAGFIFVLGALLKSKQIKLYARNLALGVWDQGLATALGQAPDISISEALGLAATLHERGEAYVSPFVLKFGKFVDLIFNNRFYCIEENHIRNSLDEGETFRGTVTHWHYMDSETMSRNLGEK